MSREIERRSIAAPIEVRAKDDGAKTLVGYAALYDTPSADLGGFTEFVRAGAFDRALRENQEVLARVEHDTRLLLGRRSNGTCRVTADAKGLRYEVDLPDTAAARDLLALVERGDVRGSSFAFAVPDENAERWSRTADGKRVRELLDLDLFDVAPTADPAYPATTVSARALERARENDMTMMSEAEMRRRALVRVLAVAPETRDQSYEDKMDSIYAALRKLLGSPWESEAAYWCLHRTYDDRVIVERFDGKRRLFEYPMAVADGVPSFGDPIEVEERYVPVAADGGEESGDKMMRSAAADLEMERLRAESGL